MLPVTPRPEWCVPGGSNSDPRGGARSIPVTAETQGGGRPAARASGRRLSAGHRVGPGGVGTNRWRSAATTGLPPGTNGEGRTLMDKIRRLLRPVRSIRHVRTKASACDGRRDRRPHGNAVDPDGLEPSSSSLQGRCTATYALGPWVRGQESNLPCQKRLGYGQVPSHDGGPGGGPLSGRQVARRGHRSHLLAISSVVKVLFRRDERKHLCKSARRTRRSAGSRTLSSAGFGGRPATGAPPLRILSCVRRSFRKSKEPLPYGSGSSGHGPVKLQFRPSRTPPWEGARRTLLGRRRRTM